MKEPGAYAILCVGKNDRSVLIEYAKTPAEATAGVFYSVLAGWLMPWADYLLFISVQPLADIVANYACHDRDKK